MSQEYELEDDDLIRYESSSSALDDHLDGDALLCPLRNLSYLKQPALVGARCSAFPAAPRSLQTRSRTLRLLAFGVARTGAPSEG